jgi:hypothetical protein
MAQTELYLPEVYERVRERFPVLMERLDALGEAADALADGVLKRGR